MNDPVSHPEHYTDGKYETIDFIEDHRLGFHYGNAVKYISRAGKKDPEKKIEDLQKAIWYMKRGAKHNNSNYVRARGEHPFPSPKIRIEDYCHEKGLSKNLTSAIDYLVVSNDTVSACQYVQYEIDDEPVVVHE